MNTKIETQATLNDWGEFAAIHDNDGDIVYYSPGMASARTLTQEEADANARAITALPYVVRALEALLVWAPSGVANDPTPYQLDAQQARAAIARVMGEI